MRNDQMKKKIEYQIRIDGIAANKKVSTIRAIEDEYKEVKSVFKAVGESPVVHDLRRLGRKTETRKRPRTILVRLKSVNEVKRILARAKQP